MSTAAGTINVPFSTTAETNYDVIVESNSTANNSEVATLVNELGVVVNKVVHSKESEISLSCTIKGANHFGRDALVGTLISNLSDADIPSPLLVTSNTASKEKLGNATCDITASYFGTDVTTGAVTALIGVVTTTSQA